MGRRQRVAVLAGVVALVVAALVFWDSTRESRAVVVRLSVRPFPPCLRESARGTLMAIVPGQRSPTDAQRGAVGRPFTLRLHARSYLFLFSRSGAPIGVPLSVVGWSPYEAAVTSARLTLTATRGCDVIPGVPD